MRHYGRGEGSSRMGEDDVVFSHVPSQRKGNIGGKWG